MKEFFKNNIVYVALFVFCASLMALAPMLEPPEGYEQGESPALTAFKEQEEKISQKVAEKGSVEEFLKTRPELEWGLRIFTAIILFGFLGGIAVNLRWLVKPGLREETRINAPPLKVNWNFTMFFRVVVLFFVWSLVLGVLFGWLQGAVFGDSSFNFFTLLHTVIIDVLCLWLMIWAVQEAGGHWKDLGFQFHDKSFWREIKFGFYGYMAIIPAFISTLLLLVIIVSFIKYEPPAHPLVNVFLEEEKRAPFLVVFSIFLAIVIGPILEEVFFRGFCYPIFRKLCGVRWGMVISSALFAAIHANIFAFLPIFILGMALSYVYEHRGSLIAPMFMHVLHNGIFITYFFFAKNMVQAAA